MRAKLNVGALGAERGARRHHSIPVTSLNCRPQPYGIMSLRGYSEITVRSRAI